MEEAKLQALADSLSGHGGRKGLGTHSGQYSWAKSVDPSSCEGGRTNLPNNQLYSNFVKEGTYNPNEKEVDGDGRVIKRDFSDIPVLVDDEKKSKKTRKKLEKKRLKLEAKKAAKLAEKKALKKALKKQKKEDEPQEKQTKAEITTKQDKKRKWDESESDEAPGTNKRKAKKSQDADRTRTKDDRKKREKKTEKKKKKKEKEKR